MFKVYIYNGYIGNRPRARTAICLSGSLSIPIEDSKVPQLIMICANETCIRISITANIKQIFKAKIKIF